MSVRTPFVTFLLCLLAVPASAFAQTAYVEGYVFDKNTGQPLRAVVVEVNDAFTNGLVPINLGTTLTDDNGLYQVPIDRFLGFPVRITGTCFTKKGSAQSSSGAILREGTIRRDLYLDDVGRRIKECFFP